MNGGGLAHDDVSYAPDTAARRAVTMLPDAPVDATGRKAWVRETTVRILVAKVAQGAVVDELAVEAAIEVARAVFDETERDDEEGGT